MVGVDFLAVLDENCFLGFLTPADDFLAVVLVLAIWDIIKGSGVYILDWGLDTEWWVFIGC